MKRAIRRHHLARMKARARKIYHYNDLPEKLANHLKCCSCHMCGNPRKYFKQKSWQEIKFINGLVAERLCG